MNFENTLKSLDQQKRNKILNTILGDEGSEFFI